MLCIEFFRTNAKNCLKKIVKKGSFQRTILVHYKYILIGIPQGLVSEPLLLLIYMNDLSGRITSISKIFADDTSLFIRSITKRILTLIQF